MIQCTCKLFSNDNDNYQDDDDNGNSDLKQTWTVAKKMSTRSHNIEVKQSSCQQISGISERRHGKAKFNPRSEVLILSRFLF